jgi:NitT/TauT family transport system permease protein
MSGAGIAMKVGEAPREKSGPLIAAAYWFYDRILPISGGVSLLLLWQFVIWFFEVRQFIAPSPLDVGAAIFSDWAILLDNFWLTLMEAVAGFVIGNIVAILLAIAFVHNKTIDKAYYPTAVFINTIPIIAVAPILVMIFGNGYTPKIFIAALICFFPTLVNMKRGLEAVSPASLDLMRILSAGKSEIFWKLRIQSSLPFLFAALKIASTTCVIGAIVGEWVGSNYGLGALILEASYNYRAPQLYAAVAMAAGMAVTFFGIMIFLERRVITWNPSQNH